jgi:SAM-dependent methyltransferase/methyltransferase-like protein
MNATDRIRQSYDDVPYDSFPYAVTHPDKMGVIGILAGVNAAPAANCRVLELGCASGGNLLPMAVTLPNSRFVGIDLSPRQIEVGNSAVKAVGATNLELRAQSIMDFPADEGPFDYIIAHGLYSWVPTEVRDKLMEICTRHLSPTGLCFISCKTYPGWHLNDVLRDLMLFHTRNQTGDAGEQATAARQMLEFVVATMEGDSPQNQIVKRMAGNLLNTPPMYLSHDHLSPISHPVYFRDFAKHAQDHGLKYIGHADPVSDQFGRLSPQRQQMINSWSSSPIEREQYVDFLLWRSIRSSILCRADAPVEPVNVREVLATLHIAGRSQESVLPDGRVKFSSGDFFLTVGDPAMIRALRTLAQHWPGSIPFAVLADSVPLELRGDLPSWPQRLADVLLKGFGNRVVELWRRPVDFVGRVGDHPRVSRLARWQAESGLPVTSLRHEMIQPNESARGLLKLLDGSRSLVDLRKIFPAEQVDRLLGQFVEQSLLVGTDKIR